MRKMPMLLCLALLAVCLLPLFSLAESAEDVFVNPTRNPNASEYSTDFPEDLQDEHLVAHSYILLERETGEILMSKNENELMYPASTTKIMTALLALEFCDDLDETLVVSERAVTLEEKSSVVPFRAGEVVTLRDALYGLILRSGNEAANAIAEHISGSIEGFVALMNSTAKAIGCHNTNFMNPNGLHDDVHYTTAYDLARMMDVALNNQDFRTIIGAPTYELSPTDHNPARQITHGNAHLLKDNNYYYQYSIGGKTGFTSKAGYCLVEAAEKNGVELIAVILYSGEYSRWPDVSRLFQYGFTKYKSVTPEEIYEQAPTELQLSGFDVEDPNLGVVELRIEAVDPSRDVRITGPVAEVDAIAADYESYTNTTWVEEARAPVAAGQVMGVLTFYPSDDEPAKYNLVATRSVKARADAPPTLEEIQRRVEEDDSLFPPLSLDWILPPAAFVCLVLFLLFRVRRLLFRRRTRKTRVPRPKKRYYT